MAEVMLTKFGQNELDNLRTGCAKAVKDWQKLEQFLADASAKFFLTKELSEDDYKHICGELQYFAHLTVDLMYHTVNRLTVLTSLASASKVIGTEPAISMT